MPEIGIGVVGGGYMGKAHSVAMAAAASVFELELRPRLEMICASTDASAERYRKGFGFARATSDWRVLVNDDRVEAIVIATPQDFHRDIAEAAFALGKPVLCEKPMGTSLADAQAMVAAAKGHINMVGYNYIRTPATQHVRKLLQDGIIGDITWFRAEMTEDFLADPLLPANWRTEGMANGCIGDLAPHIFNAALALIGPIDQVMAEIQTVHQTRPGGAVTNDDQVQMMCRFANGVRGHIFASRVATGRKMGYAYEIFGTKGSIKFDQEDQNAIWLYQAEGPEANRGFTKILTGPSHPDFLPFCQGPGHGTGYQDQIMIEAKDFLTAIHTGQNIWPTFQDGLDVIRVTEAALRSSESGTWQHVLQP